MIKVEFSNTAVYFAKGKFVYSNSFVFYSNSLDCYANIKVRIARVQVVHV